VPFYFLLVSFSTQYGRHCLWEWYLAGSYTVFFCQFYTWLYSRASDEWIKVVSWRRRCCATFHFQSFNLLNVQSLGDFDRLVILGRPLPSEYLKSQNRKLSFHFLTTVLSKWFL
jgi:hypothetical protein